MFIKKKKLETTCPWGTPPQILLITIPYGGRKPAFTRKLQRVRKKANFPMVNNNKTNQIKDQTKTWRAKRGEKHAKQRHKKSITQNRTKYKKTKANTEVRQLFYFGDHNSRAVKKKKAGEPDWCVWFGTRTSPVQYRYQFKFFLTSWEPV